MCGIIGYIGKQNALPFLIDGLERESYRGYDSSGLVIFDGQETHYIKSVGKLWALKEKLKGQNISGNTGLGHNRWATHGNVTESNAHPHVDCKQNIFVVHNGIIENYQPLKEKLQKEGHVFVSDTDTEVLSHLIEHFFKGNLEQAVAKALLQVRGAYAIAVVARQNPGKIVAARLSAPLVVSINGAGSFVASDPSAIIAHSDKMIFLEDRQMVIIKSGSCMVTDLHHHKQRAPITTLPWNIEQSEKGGHAHFMLKEILEHPESIRNALRGRLLVKGGLAKLGGLEVIEGQLKNIERVQIIACGGSCYAAMVGEYMLEEYAGLPVKVDAGSEFRYKNSPINAKTLYIFISQSGETADTLAALREVKKQGGLTVGIVNVVGSTLAREVDAGIYTHSGPEIAVASTKTFTAQLTVLALVTLFLGRQRKLSAASGRKIARGLAALSALAEKVLKEKAAIQKIARKYQHISNACVIGRKYQYPIALEGALKLKEVAYIHGEGIEGGELKHGTLSLINKDFSTIAIVPTDSVYEKMISNIQEVKARNGRVIAIASLGDKAIKNLVDEVIYIPKALEMTNPILAAIALHLLAYYLAVYRGCEIDQPRNLAKSVTVE